MTPKTPLLADDRPPEDGDWQLVQGFMQITRPLHGNFRVEDVPREQLLAALPALPAHERDLLERLYIKGQSLGRISVEVKAKLPRLSDIHFYAVIHLQAELRKQQPAG